MRKKRNDGLLIPPGSCFFSLPEVRPRFNVVNTSMRPLYIPRFPAGWLKGALMDWQKQGRCNYYWED